VEADSRFSIRAHRGWSKASASLTLPFQACVKKRYRLALKSPTHSTIP
jgi:hypothetical protein